MQLLYHHTRYKGTWLQESKGERLLLTCFWRHTWLELLTCSEQKSSYEPVAGTLWQKAMDFPALTVMRKETPVAGAWRQCSRMAAGSSFTQCQAFSSLAGCAHAWRLLVLLKLHYCCPLRTCLNGVFTTFSPSFTQSKLYLSIYDSDNETLHPSLHALTNLQGVSISPLLSGQPGAS
jgi:hypothetical protein